MRKSFDWITNNFSYVQIYIFISTLFFFSLIPIVFFWIKTHYNYLETIDHQIKAINEEQVLVDVFSSMQQYRLLLQKSARSPNNKLINEELAAIDSQINRNLEGLGELDFFKSNAKLLSEFTLWEDTLPKEIQNRWKEIIRDSPTRSLREKESLQNTLLTDLNILFDYFSNIAVINYFEEINNYIFIQSLFLRIPTFQQNLATLVLVSEKILSSESKELYRDRAQSLVDFLRSDIYYLERVLKTYAGNEISSTEISHDEIALLMKKYLNDANKLITRVESKILSPSIPTISLQTFDDEEKDLLPLGIHVWKLSLRKMGDIFKNEWHFIFNRLWAVLLTTITLSGCAFILGLVLVYKGILRLSELTQATNSFTNGDLSVRVSDTYEDEIGTQAKAFNRMAQRLEEMINYLYKLIEATSALSQGKLSKRIDLLEDKSEFDQVAISFNTMAETFEAILGRLKQIGTMLTLSASEIASASKEQETTIVKQEATTHEIAVAANEISSTSKELAGTMNEVSRSAEQTSTLALKGKDSLGNMESIMRNMVDASSKIASKLAILNEKAGNITSVITTITKVADQTNLLSLNASIEAEKAGEYGRSFAVIAREIRRLADQSAIATLDIEKMINEIITAISSSVMGVDDFTQEIRNGVEQVRTVSGQLATIIEQVQAFTGRFEIVNQGMQTQSTGAEQINESIAQLSQTARKTSEAIHQFHKTVQELNKAANELSILNPFTEKKESL